MERRDCPGFKAHKARRGCKALPGRKVFAGQRVRKVCRVFPDNREALAPKEQQGCKGRQAHRAFKGLQDQKVQRVRKARLDP